MFWKRSVDLAASFAGLLLLSPLLALIAAAVVLASGWPPLFAHERVGRGFRRFRMYKFRTMRPGSGGPQVTVKGDPRVTPIGRFLRATKLDELPQLWNVLRGDMSLVGPRPEAPMYVEGRRAQYEKLLRMRPGITDPAAIVFRDEEALLAQADDPIRAYTEQILPAKLRISENYVSSWSPGLDLVIVLQTIAILFGLPRRALPGSLRGQGFGET